MYYLDVHVHDDCFWKGCICVCSGDNLETIDDLLLTVFE